MPTLLPANVEDGWRNDAWRSWPAPDTVVHGESHYEAALVALTGPPRPRGYLAPVEVVLRPEPTNPYDKNAVRIEVGEQHVGYIARDIAPIVSGAMAALGLSSCTLAGLLRGGYLTPSEDHHNIGVMVWPDKRITPAPMLGFPGPGWVHDSWP